MRIKGKKIALLISLFSLFPNLSQADTFADSSSNVSNKNQETTQATTSCLLDVTSTTTPSVGNLPVRTYHICGFDFSSHVDTSYNHLSRSDLFVSGVPDRVFDVDQNGFTLQQAELLVARQPKTGFGGVLDFVVGRDSALMVPYGVKPLVDSQQIEGALLQSYLQYAFTSLTVIAGNFNSLPGAEFFDPTQDMNFSRGILYGYAEPNSLLGVRGTYTVNEQLSLVAGLNNGWGNVRDYSRRKTIELAMTYNPSPKYSFLLDGYSGGERYTSQVATGPMGIRTLIDFVATYNATEKLTLAANYDHDTQTKALNALGGIGSVTWQGIAGYIGYKFNDIWRTALRGEIFNDQNGFATGVRQNWKEITVTVGYAPTKHLELRCEARHDFSNVNAYLDTNGVSTSNNQQSVALELLYVV